MSNVQNVFCVPTVKMQCKLAMQIDIYGVQIASDFVYYTFPELNKYGRVKSMAKPKTKRGVLEGGLC